MATPKQVRNPYCLANHFQIPETQAKETVKIIERAQKEKTQLTELLGAPYRTVQDWNGDKHLPIAWMTKILVDKITRRAAK